MDNVHEHDSFKNKGQIEECLANGGDTFPETINVLVTYKLK
jgi:hypothetical protein